MRELFTEINNAVLDLQSAQLQTYARPLKKLSHLLNHPELKELNEKLTQGLDLDYFLAKSEETRGGMVGSSQLVWPED